MNRTTLTKLAPLAVAVATLALLAACTVQTKEQGEKKNVKIETPFGGLSVRTDPDVKDTGMPLYPGARRRITGDNDRHAANVNIDTSVFGLKVVAMEFESDDPPAKVLSFYRDQLGKDFGGKMLECTNSTFDVKVEGKHEDEKELTCGGHHGQYTELKIGTPGNQHLVAVKSRGTGSEFSLVFVRKRGEEGTI